MDPNTLETLKLARLLAARRVLYPVSGGWRVDVFAGPACRAR